MQSRAYFRQISATLTTAGSDVTTSYQVPAEGFWVQRIIPQIYVAATGRLHDAVLAVNRFTVAIRNRSNRYYTDSAGGVDVRSFERLTQAEGWEGIIFEGNEQLEFTFSWQSNITAGGASTHFVYLDLCGRTLR